ncbi:Formin-binding protein 1 [Physocladia obscura]|uniref:Formin-binding protein 1 n=1 Tax=Physocladia obscura TaxID=109957 RepID=A0AAD5TCI0_9FUNG|nr:Formin-binding protein 1 [Physocladia obscura]
MTTIANTFGSQLWDQWKDVESYTAEGTELMMGINEFMKRRAEIEAEYGHSLQKLVKPYRDEIAKKTTKGGLPIKALLESSLGKAWQQVLTEADNVATIHFGVSDKINTELRKTIKYQSQDNEKKFKEASNFSCFPGLIFGRQKFDKIRKANTELQAQVAAMEKAKADAEKKALAASDAMAFYQRAIAQEVQTDDENFRVRATKVALMKYYELYSSLIPMYIEGLETMSATFEQISADHDTELVISLMRLDDEYPPPDYTFEEKALARDANHKRPGPSGKNTGHSRAATETLLDIDDDDSLMIQPPKKGRSLAVTRVKLFDKDIAENERKRQAVESLLAICATKPTDAKQITELNFQKQSLDLKIDNLGLRKHKLQTYVATIDKTPVPELPATLAGKFIQPISTVISPVSYSAGFVSSPIGATRSSSSGVLSGSNKDLAVGAAAGTLAQQVPQISNQSQVQSPGKSTEPNSWSGVSVTDSKKAKMIYDFQAAPGGSEISANVGDDVEIIEQQDDGWWNVRVFTQGEWRTGLIPGF